MTILLPEIEKMSVMMRLILDAGCLKDFSVALSQLGGPTSHGLLCAVITVSTMIVCMQVLELCKS